nr:MAG TPA: short tail fiber protein [Caudoviricetes sp.]
MSQKWFNNIDLQQNELQNGVIQNLAADPTSGKAGQIYYNTVDKGYRYHNGTAWVSITAEAIKSIIAGNGLTSSGTDTVTISLGTPSASGSGSNTYGSNGVTANSHTHQISLPDASDSTKGVIELATDAEATAGTDTTCAINAKQLAAAKQSAIDAAKVTIQTSNGITGGSTTPGNSFTLSGVDASATAKGVVQLATQDEVNTGTNTTKVITPATLGKGKASGVASLDANSKIIASQLPDYLLGQVMYGGNVAKDDSGTVGAYISASLKEKLGITEGLIQLSEEATGGAVTGTYGYEQLEGVYFICQKSMSFGGIDDFEVGDWLISTGESWQKIDNTDAVKSVNGKTGSVVLTYTDVDAVTTKDVGQDILGNKTFKSSTANGPAIGIYGGQMSVISGTASEGSISWNTPSDNLAADFSVDENGAHLKLGIDAAADILLNESAGTAGQILVSQGANQTPIWSDTAPNAQKVAHALTVGAFPTNTATDNAFDGSAASFVRFAAPFSVTKNNNTTTVSLPSVVQKFTTTITGDGTTTDFTVQHGLGADVMVQVYLTGSTIGRRTGNELVFVDTYVEDANTHQVHLVFATAPATSQTFKVVVIG